MNGAELALAVLNHPKGGVEALMALTDNNETDWLEFKAALLPRSLQKQAQASPEVQTTKGNKENKFDGFWHVARAVVAMQNTHGGAILIGIDDLGNAVGLESSDPKNYLSDSEDLFARNCLDFALRPKGLKWKCSSQMISIEQEEYSQNIEYKFCSLNDKKIAVIIVHPIPASRAPILIQENTLEREVLLYRQRGEVGRTRTLWRVQDILNYKKRATKTDVFNKLADKFQKMIAINFYDALNETRKHINDNIETKKTVLSCIGIDLVHFWGAIKRVIRDYSTSTIQGYFLHIKVIMINPELETGESPTLMKWCENSKRTVFEIEKEQAQLVNDFKKNGGTLIVETQFYNELPNIHGWCVDSGPKTYLLSQFVFKEEFVDWNPQAYSKINNEQDDMAIQFDETWKKLEQEAKTYGV